MRINWPEPSEEDTSQNKEQSMKKEIWLTGPTRKIMRAVVRRKMVVTTVKTMMINRRVSNEEGNVESLVEDLSGSIADIWKTRIANSANR